MDILNVSKSIFAPFDGSSGGYRDLAFVETLSLTEGFVASSFILRVTDLVISETLHLSEGEGVFSGSDTGAVEILILDTLSPVESFLIHSIKQRNISQTIVLSESFAKTEILDIAFTDILHAVEQWVLSPSNQWEIDEQLFINENFTLTGIRTLVINERLSIQENNIYNNIDNLIIPTPVWIVLTDTIIQCSKTVSMYSLYGSIILDAPLFGDLISSINDLIITRTTTGKRYTYVKKSSRKHLKYEFKMRKRKYQELLQFVDNNILEWITLYNWKKETWYVKIVNDTIDYKMVGRDDYSVTLEFEGYKTVTGNYACSE